MTQNPSLPHPVLATLGLRAFGLLQIPLIAYLRPKVISITEESLTVCIPLTRRSRNHLGSMYFAALAAGADLACGFHAMLAIRRSKAKVSLIFKNMHADFLKRAESDVHFICREGILITDLVTKAVETGERVELAVPISATCQNQHGQTEEVARFTLTLSLKLKN